MRRSFGILLSFFLFGPSVLLAQNANFAGRWEAPFVWGTTPYTYFFNLEVKGNSLTGTSGRLGSDKTLKIADGTINGNDVTFTWLDGDRPIARFKGTNYGELLNLEMEEVGGKRLPEAVGGTTHPMTAIRNPGETPWYTWIPTAVDNTKMAIYRAMATLTYALVKKGDWEDAGTLSEILGSNWDRNREIWLHNNKDPSHAQETWNEIDHAMDLFILPIGRYRAGKPELADVEKAYKNYLVKMKLGD